MHAQKQAALTYIKNRGIENQKIMLRLQKDFSRGGQAQLIDYFNIDEAIKVALSNIRTENFYNIAFLKEDSFNKNGIQKLTQTLRRNEVTLRNTLEQLKYIYTTFDAKKQEGIIPFPKKVETQLKNLSNVISTLEADLNAVANGIPLQGDIKTRVKSKEGVQGYLAYTNNIGNELKGFLLPLEIIKHFNTYTKKTGIQLFDTGAWLTENSQELPVDIMGVKDASQILFSGSINGKNYQKRPLDNILQKLDTISKNKQTFTIKLDDYSDFIRQIVAQNGALIQSKATNNPPPIGSFDASLDDVANFGRLSHTGGALLRLINLKRKFNARIYASHEHYDALFSYELSKHMDAILGYEANMVLTNQGLMTLSQWVKTEFTHKYYQPRRPLSLNSENSVPIYLK